MGLPGPSSGWQSTRRMVPPTEQEQSHSPHDTVLKNFKSRFFADKRRSFRPLQIPRMLRRKNCYRKNLGSTYGHTRIEESTQFLDTARKRAKDYAEQENYHHCISSIVSSHSGRRRYSGHEHHNLHPEGQSRSHHYIGYHARSVDHKHARYRDRHDFNPDPFHRLLQNLDIQRYKLSDQSLEQGIGRRPTRKSKRVTVNGTFLQSPSPDGAILEFAPFGPYVFNNGSTITYSFCLCDNGFPVVDGTSYQVQISVSS